MCVNGPCYCPLTRSVEAAASRAVTFYSFHHTHNKIQGPLQPGYWSPLHLSLTYSTTYPSPTQQDWPLLQRLVYSIPIHLVLAGKILSGSGMFQFPALGPNCPPLGLVKVLLTLRAKCTCFETPVPSREACHCPSLPGFWFPPGSVRLHNQDH